MFGKNKAVLNHDIILTRNTIFILFSLPDFSFANWISRTPEVRDVLQASAALMGWIIFGLAAGLFPGYTRLFGIVAVLFVIGVLYFRRSEELSGPLINSSLGFLVGGAIGNGIDRLLIGEVTDFIVRSGGILNIADHAIEIGVLLIVIYMLISWLKSKKRNLDDE